MQANEGKGHTVELHRVLACDILKKPFQPLKVAKAEDLRFLTLTHNPMPTAKERPRAALQPQCPNSDVVPHYDQQV